MKNAGKQLPSAGISRARFGDRSSDTVFASMERL